jgi:hypothetical protein
MAIPEVFSRTDLSAIIVLGLSAIEKVLQKLG